MLVRFPFIVCLLIVAAQGCEQFPNSTETHANWFACPDSNTPVWSLKLTDSNNKEEYPVKLTEPLYVLLNFTSLEEHKDLRLDIDVSSWGGWGGCSWHKVPTFGLLNNLNACEHGVQCPIKMGNQEAKIAIDFTKYSKIISLLKDDSAYQIQYKLTDRHTDKVTCTVVQARSLTK